ncbi:sensor histidine kinase [Eubacteriales bacterium DFI.9.88]|nr:sensor histidine kinase [Eubacteriales bacterium DFI.9.88]
MTKKKMIFALICITFAAFCLIVFLTIFTEHTNKKIYRSEMEEKLYYANASYTNNFNQMLEQMRTVADTVAAQTGAIFKYSDYTNNTQRYRQDKAKLDRAVQKILKQEKNISSLYITFDPQKFPNRQEIWYIRKNVDDIEHVDSAKSAKTWLLKSNPNTKYFYEAMEKGSYWGGLDWETILSRYNITYTRSIRDAEGTLLGIAGVDIISDKITKIVENIKVYNNSNTYLFDEDFKCIAKSADAPLDDDVYRSLKSHRFNLTEEPKVYYFEAAGRDKLVITESKLINNWYLAFTQPEGATLEPINTSIVLTCLLVILAAILLVLINLFFFKNSIAPVIDKVEDQEVFIIHQARQAKLGEMIGNITHQLKQPINNANIVLSNMQEDLEEENIDRAMLKNHLDVLQQSLDTLIPIIDDFAGFLKPDRKKSRIHVYSEVSNCLSLLQMQLQFARIQVTLDIDERIYLYGYKNEFCQCLLNILGNGIDALKSINGRSRQIKISVSLINQTAVICIYNDGSPIDTFLAQTIFEPYVTTKAESGGTGIGLYLTKQIIKEHFDGTLYYQNQKNGVEFIMEIPVEGVKNGQS